MCKVGERMNTTSCVYATVIFVPILFLLSRQQSKCWRVREGVGPHCGTFLWLLLAWEPLRAAKPGARKWWTCALNLPIGHERSLSFPSTPQLLTMSFTDQTRGAQSWGILRARTVPSTEESPTNACWMYWFQNKESTSDVWLAVRELGRDATAIPGAMPHPKSRDRKPEDGGHQPRYLYQQLSVYPAVWHCLSTFLSVLCSQTAFDDKGVFDCTADHIYFWLWGTGIPTTLRKV